MLTLALATRTLYLPRFLQVAHHSAVELSVSVVYEVLPVRDSIVGLQEGLRRAFLRHDKGMQVGCGYHACHALG